MSSDDFQTKYSSVMESMLKSAIAETTKLFETMVDDLKAEISKIKTENEDLKRRCSQFENARSKTTTMRESESVPGQSRGSDKRDTAVQCDLVSFHTMLVEQCEPLRPSSLQNQEQQSANVTTQDVWQEHNYENRGKRDSLIALLPKKQLEFDFKQKEVEPIASFGQVFRNDTGSPLVSACGTENGGRAINKECSNAEKLSPQRNEETGVALGLPHLGMVGSLTVVHKQSSEQVLSQHISSTPKPTAPNKGEELKKVVAKEASIQPDIPVRRRRGRPPKKAKHLKRPVKIILPPSSEQKKEMKKIFMEDGAIKAPSTAVSSTIKTQNTPTTKSPQVPSVQSRQRHTSVTLQDAMLLVEAMNQSTGEKELDSPQIMAVKTLQTVREVPAQSGTQPVDLQTTTTDEALAHKKVVILKQHMVSLSNTAKSSIATSAAATQTVVKSLKQSPSNDPIKPLAHSKQENAVPKKIFVMSGSLASMTSSKFAAKSPTQLSTDVSTVHSAQNKSEQPSSTPLDKPLEKPSISSVKQQKSLPVDTSQSTPPQTDLQSLSHPKITIVIPRQLSAVALRKQKMALAKKQELPQLMPQELSMSGEVQSILDKVATILSTKQTNTSDNLDSSKQTDSCADATNEPSETSSSLDMSSGLPLPIEQKVSAVVRLNRLPFPMAKEDVVLLSRMPRNESAETRSLLEEGATEEKPSSVPLSTQPSETPVSSSDICSNSKETSVSLKTPEMSGTQHNVPRELPLRSGRATGLDESSTSSRVSASVLSKSTIIINTIEPSALPEESPEQTTSKLQKEIISIVVPYCTSPSDPAIEQSPAVIHLRSIKPKDPSDPHLQMTKRQFLAQLAVSPIVQDPKQPPTNDSVDTNSSCPTTSTSTSDKKQLQKDVLVANLRHHLKTHIQARNSETSQESCTETETLTGCSNKAKLEEDSPEDTSTAIEPIPLSPKEQGTVLDVTSPKKTTSDPSPITTRRSGICKDSASSKRSLRDLSPVSSRRFKASGESMPVNPNSSNSGRDCIDSKHTKTSSVSPRTSNSTVESASPKKTRNTSVSPRRSNSTKPSASPKKTRNTSVSPRRSNSTKPSAIPKKTRNTSVSPRRSNSTKPNAIPKKTRNISVSPRRSSSTKQCSTPKKTKITPVNPRRTCSTKEIASPKKIKTIYVHPRRTSSTGDGPSPKSKKTVGCPTETPKRTRSFSTRPGTSGLGKNYSSPKVPTNDGASSRNAKSRTNLQNVGRTKLAEGVSSSKTGESTPAKKPKLAQVPCPKNNLRGVDSKNSPKDKTVAKIENQSNLLNGAKTSQLAENSASTENVKKCTATGLWTPPTLLIGKTPLALRKRSMQLETESQDQTLVYPPSVSRHPIPVKAPAVVSPLQPLSVIGWRLLKNQCGECGRVLSSNAALESHVSLHAGRRPFSCTLCGKRFPDSKGLKRHGRVHRNGRIHICKQCGKGFVYSFGLTKHLQIVHGRIKPFVCQVCNKGFFSKRDVEAHIRIHTGEKPFHCNLCEKKFARRTELNMHLRWHNGEKRHWCPYCGKGFLDLNNLKRHKYTHTGEKPHSCPHCPKNFSQSGHLKKHVKNVHKIQ
ncbi:mucin-2 isoform X2 [Labrus mixtus]|uniref:mucin-2 isoform X2 n=1 Tax=Labrus mixtus TaxID=508554 RepID=UPI0029C0232E|nr:mucin-2 isoform X2 [Labrus mixtus]